MEASAVLLRRRIWVSNMIRVSIVHLSGSRHQELLGIGSSPCADLKMRQPHTARHRHAQMFHVHSGLLTLFLTWVTTVCEPGAFVVNIVSACKIADCRSCRPSSRRAQQGGVLRSRATPPDSTDFGDRCCHDVFGTW